MGWNWVIHLAKDHDLWVLTEANECESAIKAYFEEHPKQGKHITVIGIPRERFGEEIWSSFFYYWTYRRWQADAYITAVELHQKVGFDLAHQLNMIGFREPGYLWKLPIPFIWGPIGGHAQMPWRFMSSLGWRSASKYTIRNILNWVQMYASWRVRKAARKAAVLIAATEEDRTAIVRIHKRAPLLMNEQGAKGDLEVSPKIRDKKAPLRVAWCGLFLGRKGLPLGLKALRYMANENQLVELDIIGSGECEVEWRALADDLLVSGMCRWYGMVSHAKAQEIMASCDVLLFTSIQEGTPAVVIEAIQAGLPVICHDSCGFGAIIDETCGIKVPVLSPKISSRGFADALITLATNPERYAALSKGALKKAKILSWENKVKVLAQVYLQTTGVYVSNATEA
jgi:glycosyltransferase involved in cell wall biosynthesis